MRKILFALSILLAMTACSKSPKILVLYYSQCGTTKTLSEKIQAQIEADVCSFDVEQVYDGTYEETIQRCLDERASDYIPDLKPIDCNISDYDVIFLGYPIWFGTYARPVMALIRDEKFAGKTIVPFCTFGSGGILSSTEDLRNALPQANIMAGYGVRTARIAAAEEELNRFLIENGWKDGQIELLPEFSDMQDVTETETAIFDAACSGYKYPLGKAFSFASRPVKGGTEYLFISESRSPDGKSVQAEIYVNAIDGQTPEFTQVIR